MRIKVGKLSELLPAKWLVKQVLTKKVAVYHGIVRCNWHGWHYDLKTGQCLTSTFFKLKTYPVEISNGDVYLIL